MANGVDQQALFGLARDHDRTRLASLEGRGAGVQPQASLQGFRLARMAFKTVLDQQRPQLSLEELDLFGRDLAGLAGGGVIGLAGDRHQQGQCDQQATVHRPAADSVPMQKRCLVPRM